MPQMVFLHDSHTFYPQAAKSYYSLAWYRMYRCYLVNPMLVKSITENRNNKCLLYGEILPISRINLKAERTVVYDNNLNCLYFLQIIWYRLLLLGEEFIIQN